MSATDLTSRLRAIVRPARPSPEGGTPPRRELTYEPDDGRRYEATLDLEQVADALGGRLATTAFGACLVIDRRYESDRWHGDVQIGECEIGDSGSLGLLDPAFRSSGAAGDGGGGNHAVFIDLETTGLSGGAGTVAFLVGVRLFRPRGVPGAAVPADQLQRGARAAGRRGGAVRRCRPDRHLQRQDVRRAGHGNALGLPPLPAPLDDVPHFDMLHPARRLWRSRSTRSPRDGGCRLTTLERALLNLRRVGDVDGFEIPGRFFQFLRTGDPRPLEPVLEHNRLDLVSLAAVTSRALRLTAGGEGACRDGREALAVGRVLERAGVLDRAEACYRRAAESSCVETRAESLYCLALRLPPRPALRGGGRPLAGAPERDRCSGEASRPGARHAARLCRRGAGHPPRTSRPRPDGRAGAGARGAGSRGRAGGWRCREGGRHAAPAGPAGSEAGQKENRPAVQLSGSCFAP